MAYTTRRAAQKQLRSAIGNLDTCLYHLNNVRAVYKDAHPDIANGCEAIMQLVLKAQELIKAFLRSF